MPKLNQQQLLDIFNALKAEMKPYETGCVKALFDLEGKFDLWSVKKLVIADRKHDGIGFAAIIIQSGYVGFYYMPIYGCDDISNKLSPGFMKCLKGKACFHIKDATPETLENVRIAMKIGYNAYQQRGWV